MKSLRIISKSTSLTALMALFLFVLSWSATPSAWAEASKPKFGPTATRLYDSRDYIKKSPAADFWAFSPYYLPQQDGRSCSVASVTMLINAARADQKLTASDELITQPKLLEKAGSEDWKKYVGALGRGVTLDQLGGLIEKSLKAYDIPYQVVQVIHVDSTGAEATKKIHDLLVLNEKSSHDFIVANFLQSEYTGDPEGKVGHIAPIGAYDAIKKQVLVMDPDREYYEPYWVSEQTFIKGMATQDPESKKNRGLVYVKLK